VLAEGDDQMDPIADSARAILDGHIVLSRNLADQGHYPAIDIEASISRAMNSLITNKEFDLVRRFKSLYSRYQRSRDLINVGAYVRGTDPQLDEAIMLYPHLEAFLRQPIEERVGVANSRHELATLLGMPLTH
jgi:flagellum-specific ATP synthase